MLTCNMNVIMLTSKIDKLTVNIIMLHVNNILVVRRNNKKMPAMK